MAIIPYDRAFILASGSPNAPNSLLERNPMTLRIRLLSALAAAALAGWAASGQGKPNYSGTWELTTIERSGMKITAGKTYKETQVWVHEEPKLNLKIMVWEEKSGYRTLDLTYTTNGATGLVGYLARPDGTKAAVNGSARWDGNRLVYEEEIPTATKGAPRRIIRTCTLEEKGQKMIFHQVYWMAGENASREEQWLYEKKITP
jgi:hypothetical protein